MFQHKSQRRLLFTSLEIHVTMSWFTRLPLVQWYIVMHLPGVFQFIKKQKEPPPSHAYIALQIGTGHSKAALWELSDTVTIRTVVKEISPREAVQACLQGRTDVHEVIFGLSDEYIHDNSIKEDHLPELQQIIQHTSLKPSGFVVIHEAIAYLLKEETQTPQTAFLIGFEPEHINFALYRVGICKLQTTIKRTGDLFADFEKGLQAFSQEEILPSKILVYNEGSTLDSIREQLLSYPWQQNDQFLHVPKIEALAWEYSIKAVVYAGAHELSQQTLQPPEHVIAAAPLDEPQETSVETIPEHAEQIDTVEEEAPQPAMSEQNPHHVSSDELLDEPEPSVAVHDLEHTDDEITDDMGFREGVDILHDAPYETPMPTAHVPQSQPLHADSQLPQQTKPSRTLPSFPLLRAPHSLMVAGGKSLVVASVFLLLLAGVVGGAVFWYPKATIALIAEPKLRNEEVQLTLNTSISSVDLSGKQIPGTVHTVKVKGAKTGEATGKKTIGDKATGTIIVYNKTPTTKTLKKGSVLAATSSLTFTLDNDVNVASASDTGESLAYGKGTASVTASKVGPSGNIKKETELKITDYDSNAVIAKNEEQFSGGTERQITVVSEADQQQLVKSLTNELEQQAQSELSGKVLGSQTFLPESLKEHVVEKTFDKKPGDEANIVSLDMELEYSQTSYEKESINQFLREYMKDKIDEGFTLDTDKSYFTVLETSSDDESVTFTAQYTAYLLPEIDTDSLHETFAGKSLADVEKIVHDMSDNNIVGYEIDQERRIPFLSFLPFRPTNITVKVVPY